MSIEAWYDPTNHVVSTDKNDPRFTSLGQLWRLVPEKEWVSLTDEDIAQAMYKTDAIITGPKQFDFAKELEAKLKEKNRG
jgi:2-phospho-L-lactate transferase/gluconeogenesis factor (CofD/UPF0052 family)